MQEQLKYLVAVDNSADSVTVLAAAREFADATGAHLACMTVLRPLAQIHGHYDTTSIPVGLYEQEKLQKSQATDCLQQYAKGYGIGADDLHVVIGQPATQIRAMAVELAVDLIIIGTHGRHGLGLILGSTASSLLHGVDRNTLVVRISAQDSS